MNQIIMLCYQIIDQCLHNSNLFLIKMILLIKKLVRHKRLKSKILLLKKEKNFHLDLKKLSN